MCRFHKNFKASTFLTPQPTAQSYVEAIRSNGSFYLLLDVWKQNWTQARDLCLKVNGTLIYSEDSVWMKSVKRFYGVVGFYLGLQQVRGLRLLVE